MLGYVQVFKPDLKVREYEIYMGYYCGVCKYIGKEYGQLPRMALSYDAAFLALLPQLTGLPPALVFGSGSFGWPLFAVFAVCGILITLGFAVLAAGFVLLWLVPSVIPAEGVAMKIPVFIGSFLMMSGYLSGMAAYGTQLRNYTPEHMAGRFQGLRILSQVLIPGIIGPQIGAWVLRDAPTISNSDGTTSFLPSADIFLTALIVLAVLIVALSAWLVHNKNGAEGSESMKTQVNR